MKWKKVLLVFYSRSGNSRKFAEETARELGCDVQELKTPVSYTGFWGYQRALIHALFGIAPQIDKIQANLRDYDLVIVGGPVWGGALSGPIRTFLNEHKGEAKNIAFFLTQDGHFGRDHLFEQMKQVCEKVPLAVVALSKRQLSAEKLRVQVSAFLGTLQARGPAEHVAVG